MAVSRVRPRPFAFVRPKTQREGPGNSALPSNINDLQGKRTPMDITEISGTKADLENMVERVARGLRFVMYGVPGDAG
jgi:hypothetical protein